MARVRVKVIHDKDLGFHCDLPDYTMVPGSWLPLIADVTFQDGVFPTIDPTDPRLSRLTCEVDVPDRLVNPGNGRVDFDQIKAVYRGQPKWDAPGRQLDI